MRLIIFVILLCIPACFKQPLAETAAQRDSDHMTSKIRIKGDKNIVQTYIIMPMDSIPDPDSIFVEPDTSGNGN